MVSVAWAPPVPAVPPTLGCCPGSVGGGAARGGAAGRALCSTRCEASTVSYFLGWFKGSFLSLFLGDRFLTERLLLGEVEANVPVPVVGVMQGQCTARE